MSNCRVVPVFEALRHNPSVGHPKTRGDLISGVKLMACWFQVRRLAYHVYLTVDILGRIDS